MGATKRYTKVEKKARKCDKEAINEPDLDPAAQAELLRALRDEFHPSNPLQQQVADQADIDCGINQRGKDLIILGLDQQVGEIGGRFIKSIQIGDILIDNTVGDGLRPQPPEQAVDPIEQLLGEQEKPEEEESMDEWMNGEYNMEGNYEESVLGSFESESDLDLSDGEEDGQN